MSRLWLCFGHEWVAGQSSTYRGPGLGRVLGAPVHPAASTSHNRRGHLKHSLRVPNSTMTGPNNEIKATSARRGDRCFDQKGNCWRRTATVYPEMIIHRRSCPDADICPSFSSHFRRCWNVWGLNGIVTFHNPHRRPLVKHPRAPLSF